ncbi:unnamed protein product [Closterium sp. Naga37s-1]|nr:unnamed protein product [Closterium sp. Naga37s-1]
MVDFRLPHCLTPTTFLHLALSAPASPTPHICPTDSLPRYTLRTCFSYQPPTFAPAMQAAARCSRVTCGAAGFPAVTLLLKDKVSLRLLRLTQLTFLESHLQEAQGCLLTLDTDDPPVGHGCLYRKQVSNSYAPGGCFPRSSVSPLLPYRPSALPLSPIRPSLVTQTPLHAPSLPLIVMASKFVGVSTSHILSLSRSSFSPYSHFSPFPFSPFPPPLPFELSPLLPLFCLPLVMLR